MIKCLTLLLYFAVTWFFVSSCSQNRKQHPHKQADIVVLPKMTLLASLPDSNKPTITFLEKTPKSKNFLPGKLPAVYSFIHPITHLPVFPEAQGIGSFRNFTTDQGLATDAIYCAAIDKKGNLWFGTSNGGISRYDGKKFTNYTTRQGLSHNSIFCITEDKKGNIWIGTIGGGLNCYDGKRFTNYTTKQGLVGNSVSCIIEDKKGRLWIGTEYNGVSCYDGKKFTNYTTVEGLADNGVYCIAEDKKGNLWFGATYGQVSCFDGERFTNYNFNRGQGMENNVVWSILEDKAGDLWFGTNNYGVNRFDGKKVTNYTSAQGLPSNSIFKISEDKKGNLWIATDSGVSRFDGKQFTNFTTIQGLANNIVWSITEDRNDNLWFGTYGGGVSCYNGKAVTNFTISQGLPNNTVLGIGEDRSDNLWLGTYGGGISRYNGKSFTNYTETQGLSSNFITSIIKDKKEDLWFGTVGGGVIQYNGKDFVNYTNRQWLPLNNVLSIKEDKNGNLWFGTQTHGLSVYDGNQVINYTTAQGLANNSINCIAEDKKGNLWLGTNDGGVSRFDGKSFTNYTIAQGLPNNTIIYIIEDKLNNIWFGTNEGVSRFDGKTFINYKKENGLPDNVVTNIIIDSGDNVIFGTNSGVGVLVAFTSKSTEKKMTDNVPPQNKLSNEELKGYIPKIEIYNSSTGYPVKEANWGQPAMFKDHKGIIWIGTASDKTGLVRFDYSAIHKNTDPPVIELQNIKINNESISWHNLLPDSVRERWIADSNIVTPGIAEEITLLGKELSDAERDNVRLTYGNIKFDSITKWHTIPINLVLPYDHNSISFDFNAIETGRNHLVKYQYILEGYDKIWSPITPDNSASFGNMYEGAYSFRLKAMSPEGIWSDTIVYKFVVLPPWYRTFWAYLLYALLAIGAIWIFIKWRIKGVQKEKTFLEEKIKVQDTLFTERIRISRDLHDEIGATLSGIAMYSHLSKEQVKNKNINEVEKSLNIMQQSAGEMVNKLNDIVWLINPDQDSLQKLIERLEEYARDMAAIKNMEVAVRIPENIAAINLPIESRRNIYTFCKEAINNAVKYSNATLLELIIKETNGKMEFSVSDNGKGFDAVMVRRGNGLVNMQQRADEIGAKLLIQSQHDGGSQISLQCKIT
ncbi:MAG: two-component regulator propeller domain-containing protein [Ferruginibacter sp.]